MPVSLSIKNVPDEWVERLKARAAANHRSLQGELMALIEQNLAEEPTPKHRTLAEIYAEALAEGRNYPADGLSIIQADRRRDDDRY